MNVRVRILIVGIAQGVGFGRSCTGWPGRSG
jgi:hypothetical protein